MLRHRPAPEEVVSCGTSVTGSLCPPLPSLAHSCLTQACVWVWYGLIQSAVHFRRRCSSCAVCTRECSCPCGATTSHAAHCCKSRSTLSKIGLPRVSLLDNHRAENKSPANTPLAHATAVFNDGRCHFAHSVRLVSAIMVCAVPRCLHRPAKKGMRIARRHLLPTKPALRQPGALFNNGDYQRLVSVTSVFLVSAVRP